MSKKNAVQTNVGLRELIIKTYNEIPGPKRGKIKKVYNKLNGKVTEWQIRNTINGRVKLDRSPRADKGQSREALGSVITSRKLDEFETVEEFLESQLTDVANYLQTTKITYDKKLIAIQRIAKLNKELKAAKLESYIKRPEAVLIIEIMKYFKPEISDDEIQKIYRELYERVKRRLTG